MIVEIKSGFKEKCPLKFMNSFEGGCEEENCEWCNSRVINDIIDSYHKARKFKNLEYNEN